MLKSKFKDRLYEIVFEADTVSGKLFDVLLLVSIVLSVLVVMLESVVEIGRDYSTLFFVAEWVITVLFSIEYVVRIYIVNKPRAYIFSFYGMVDLLSILPTYLGLFVGGAQGLLAIRALRLLRVFRILKLTHYIKEGHLIMSALRASTTKIFVFLFAVVTMVIVMGSLMYLIEGAANGFTSIPKSVYWAIVTLTTVGYGDIAPQTTFGQFVASVVMVMGYAIIAVPTGSVTVELASVSKGVTTQVCPECWSEGHDKDADYCKFCGEKLN